MKNPKYSLINIMANVPKIIDVYETPKSGHDLETCTEHNYIPGDDFYSTPTCIVCGYEATIGLDGKIKKELKPCGEGENICNCKSQDECGYIEIEKRIRDLETCTEKEVDRVETPIQEEEREEMVWEEVMHFYNSGDPLEDTYSSMIRQLMNKYELKRK